MMDAVERISNAAKMKDAAGLGTLAYALSEGDQSVLSGGAGGAGDSSRRRSHRPPDDFWDWVIGVTETERALSLVRAAQRNYRRGGWRWDRAFMLAAAYIAALHGVPDSAPSAKPSLDCPLWVGLDKHTPVGRAALRAAAKRRGVRWRQIIWVSFYFESARTNELRHSMWWDREVSWRLGRVGLTTRDARSLWERVCPTVIDALVEACDTFATHLSGDTAPSQPVLV